MSVSYRKRWAVEAYTVNKVSHVTTQHLNFTLFVTAGRDLCPTAVLWLRQETETRHALIDLISLSSIRVMYRLFENQSLGVFSLNPHE